MTTGKDPRKPYKNFMTFVNPEIVSYSDKVVKAWEGCLSWEDEVKLIERPAAVKV